jgi:type I restriction enzyme M protein
MFMERYRDLLVEGGRLLTVIDDGLLAGDDFSHVRDFIRNEFLIRGVISLPGDAFQRSGARAKTTVLYLEKRQKGEVG